MFKEQKSIDECEANAYVDKAMDDFHKTNIIISKFLLK